MKPTITIIMATYNRAHFILETLHSIQNQTYENWECIIIDDGSTDVTDSIFEKLKNYDLPFQWEYHKKENGGKHTALNFAHAYIKGEV